MILAKIQRPNATYQTQGHWPFCSRQDDSLEGFFVPYKGMMAILVKWPETKCHTYIVLSNEYSIWNLSSISPVVSEKKMLRYARGSIQLAALDERSKSA